MQVGFEVLFVEDVSLKTFLEAACKAVDGLPNPLERNGAGRPRFDYRSRIAVLLVKAWLNRGHRDTEVYLNDNRETIAVFGLKVPDHNTIWRTITSLSEPYLKELNKQVAVNLKRGTRHSRRRNGLWNAELHLLEKTEAWASEGT